MNRYHSLLCLLALSAACSQTDEALESCDANRCDPASTGTTADSILTTDTDSAAATGAGSTADEFTDTGTQSTGAVETGGATSGGSSNDTETTSSSSSSDSAAAGSTTTATTDDTTASTSTADTSTGSSFCGDGSVDEGEACDDGDDNGTYNHCSLDCNGLAAHCGDGNVDADLELCDDGNRDANDGCDADCQPSAITAIASGMAHNCVLLRTGAIKCWGANADGRLGYGHTEDIGDNEDPATAGVVDVGGAVQQLALGQTHTCALRTDGQVRCWGNGAYGRLGLGNTDDVGDDEAPSSVSAVAFSGPEPPIAITSNPWASHTCALFSDGDVTCWGYNASGRLGQGNSESLGDDETLVQVPPVPLGVTTTDITVGGSHTCARLVSGNVRCWGSDGSGQLGNGFFANAIGDAPDELSDTLNIPDLLADLVTAGQLHTCAARGDQVWCWGPNVHGMLGIAIGWTVVDAPLEAAATVLPASPRSVITKLIAGAQHTCALYDNGTLRCWGRNDHGQLGDGSTDDIGGVAGDVAEPIEFGEDVRVVDVSAGWQHTCALLEDGAVKCWGGNASGQLGYADQGDRAAWPVDLDPVVVF